MCHTGNRGFDDPCAADGNIMPNDPQPATESLDHWTAIQTQLRPDLGERHPFMSLKDINQVELEVLSVETDPTRFHGGFSMFEMDVKSGGKPYRLAVSGTRMARAIVGLKPAIGDRIVLTSTGTGRERSWTAHRAS